MHIVAETPEKATLDRALDFRVARKQRIGEQRIDVLVRAPGFTPRLIDEVALEKGVML